jgi:hypothetical protein
MEKAGLVDGEIEQSRTTPETRSEWLEELFESDSILVRV